MIFETIYKDIVSSFGELWKSKERGKSFEIITPFSTTSQKFVSVFLTEREGEYVISDGGWIFEGLYDNSFDQDIGCFEKIFSHYIESFNVKEVKNLSGSKIFYKTTNKRIAIPGIIFDLATFISTIVSLTTVEYSDKEEKENESNFIRSARTYLQNMRPKKDWADWHFNEYLDAKREVKPSAILRKKDSKVVLLNFITGSHYQYFRTGISKTNMIFELAEKSKESIFIEKKIALLDNKAKGYQPEHFSIWLDHLLSKPKSSKIEWTRKKELEKI